MEVTRRSVLACSTVALARAGTAWQPKLAENLHEATPAALRWLRQLGGRHAVFQPSARLEKRDRVGGGRPYWDLEDVLRVKHACDEAGLSLASMMLPIDFYPHALLGGPGRDRAIENVCRTVRAVAAAGVPMMEGRFWPDFFFDERVGCYTAPGRGGAGMRAFEYARVENAAPFPDIGVVDEPNMWARFLYFARPFDALLAYRACGYMGPIVSDHTPQIEGDTAWGHTGRAYSLGYIRALVHAANRL